MTPNLASIGMCCILRQCWSNRMKPVSVPRPPYCYFYSESACLAWSPPIDKWHYTFWACWCMVTHIWRDTHTQSYKHARQGKKSPRLLRIIQAMAGWYVGRTSTCPCLPGFSSLFQHSPKDVLLWAYVRVLGVLYLPAVRQTDDSKPCFTPVVS